MSLCSIFGVIVVGSAVLCYGGYRLICYIMGQSFKDITGW